jgi:hypothetical protein
MKKSAIYVFCCCLLGANAAVAQTSNVARGNIALSYKDYAAAMPLYEAALTDEPNNAEALSKLAACYRATYHLAEAEKTYEKLVALNAKTSDDVFEYAQLLMQLRKYEAAKTQFAHFATTFPEIGNYFVAMCDYAAAHTADAPNYVVTNEPFNSAAADFCATFYSPTQMVFAATRDPQTGNSQLGTPSRLFVATADAKGQFGNVKLEKRSLNQKESEGPVSFTATGTQAAFARNSIKNGISPLPQGGGKQDVFFGTLKAQGLWLPENRAFVANSPDYSVAYPYLTPDGNTLYFASDMPNGVGGFDLYKSEKIGDKWTTPANLGDKINTAGDEITPYTDGSTLYFASNWYLGFGGFDIFKTDLVGNEAAVENLGTGINSSGDDFGYVYNTAANFGFITSNRTGGKGQEDIYKVVSKTANVVAITANTAPVIEPVIAAATAPETPVNTAKTGTAAKAIAQINATKATAAEYHAATLRKAAAQTATIANAPIDTVKNIAQAPDTMIAKAKNIVQNTPIVTKKDTAIANNTKIIVTNTPIIAQKDTLIANNTKIIPTTPIAMPIAKQKKGYILDAATDEPLNDVLVTLTNKTDKTQPPLQTSTDEEGLYSFALLPNTAYWLQYAKENYTSDWRQIRTAERVPTDIFGYFRLKPTANTPTNAVVKTDTPAAALPTEPIKRIVKALPRPTYNPVTSTPVAINPPSTTPELAPASTTATVYEIVIITTNQALSVEAQDALRKHGTLFPSQQDDLITYKLGWYDNEACANATRDKVREMGYQSAISQPKEVQINDNVTKMRLMLGKQKASCPVDKVPPKVNTNGGTTSVGQPSTGSQIIAEEDNAVAAKPTNTASPEPAEGDLLPAETTDEPADDGYIYYIQIGAVTADKKVSFKQIEALKIGTVLKTKADDGRDIYAIGAFHSRSTAEQVRRLVKATGEAPAPFIRKYDKAGNKL